MASDDEHTPTAGFDEPALSSNGIFAHSHDFTVAGGTFVNMTNQCVAAPTDPPDFRMIPMGDIDLQRQLSVHKELGVLWRRPRQCVMRVHSAKVEGRSSDVIVAMYQGDGAEEEWQRDLATYMLLRHPNIIQIYAGARYGKLHATVFHGDLVPFKQYMAAHSPIVTVYLYGLYTNRWLHAEAYCQSALPQRNDILPRNCTLSVHASTGRLTAALVLPEFDNDRVDLSFGLKLIGIQEPASFDPSNYESIAIQSLSLRDYHEICNRYLSEFDLRFKPISPTATVTLGALATWTVQDRPGIDVASIAAGHSLGGWSSGGGWGYESLSVMENERKERMQDLKNGWRRCYPHKVLHAEMRREMHSNYGHSWLSQANHIFRRLQIKSKFEDHVLIDSVEFNVRVDNPTLDCPPGYLFLCPANDFQIGARSFRWPDHPAYWSLDPSGAERLSAGEATRLGFPPFRLTTKVRGRWWNASVYTGLRQFHQAKGFDPESQEVARHLGEPLWQVLPAQESLFAHVTEADQDGDELDVEEDTSESWIDSEEDAGVLDNIQAYQEDGVEFDAEEDDIESRIESEEDAGVLDIIQVDQEESLPTSYKVLMNVKFALILFLAMCWVYDNTQ